MPVAEAATAASPPLRRLLPVRTRPRGEGGDSEEGGRAVSALPVTETEADSALYTILTFWFGISARVMDIVTLETEWPATATAN